MDSKGLLSRITENNPYHFEGHDRFVVLNMNIMRLPDFLIIGAARCGTTTLHEMLKSQPGVYLPENKRPEPFFFLRDAEYQKGIAYYSKKYFSAVDVNAVAGETSTTYIYSRKASTRIACHLPNIRILAILRNPVERAYSHYRWNVLHRLETLSFSEAIRAEDHRLKNTQTIFEEESSPFSYVDRGRFYTQLSRYITLFGNRQVHVVLFENLIKDTEWTAMSITDFLGAAVPGTVFAI